MFQSVRENVATVTVFLVAGCSAGGVFEVTQMKTPTQTQETQKESVETNPPEKESVETDSSEKEDTDHTEEKIGGEPQEMLYLLLEESGFSVDAGSVSLAVSRLPEEKTLELLSFFEGAVSALQSLPATEKESAEAALDEMMQGLTEGTETPTALTARFLGVLTQMVSDLSAKQTVKNNGSNGSDVNQPKESLSIQEIQPVTVEEGQKGSLLALVQTQGIDPSKVSYLWAHKSGPELITEGPLDSASLNFEAPLLSSPEVSVWTISVSSESISKTLQAQVEISATNAKPTATLRTNADASSASVSETDSISLIHTISDSDSASLDVVWTIEPADIEGVALKDVSSLGVRVETSERKEPVEVRIIATTSDETNEVVTEFPLTINAENDAPSISLPHEGNALSVTEGGTVTVNWSVDDPDDESLSTTWALVSGNSDLVTWAETESTLEVTTLPAIANHNLVFEISSSDGENTITETIEISVQASNDGPSCSLSQASELNASEDSDVIVAVSCSDTDSESLSYAWSIVSDVGSTLSESDSDSVTVSIPNIPSDSSLDVVSVTVSDESTSIDFETNISILNNVSDWSVVDSVADDLNLRVQSYDSQGFAYATYKTAGVEFVVLKLDADGNEVWRKSYANSSGWGGAFQVSVSPDNSKICLAHEVVNMSSPTSIGGEKSYVFVLDAETGNELHIIAADEKNGSGTFCSFFPNGDLLMVWQDRDGVDPDLQSFDASLQAGPTLSLTSSPISTPESAMLARINVSGASPSLIWDRQLHSPDLSSSYTGLVVAAAHSNAGVFAAVRYSTDTLELGDHVGGRDVAVYRLNNNTGAIEHSSRIAGPSDERVRWIHALEDKVVFIGATDSSLYGPNPNSSKDDCFAVAFSLDLHSTVWSEQWGGSVREACMAARSFGNDLYISSTTDGGFWNLSDLPGDDDDFVLFRMNPEDGSMIDFFAPTFGSRSGRFDEAYAFWIDPNQTRISFSIRDPINEEFIIENYVFPQSFTLVPED